MRVLHLTSEYPPHIWGGLGTAVGGLTVASARAGIETDVLLVRHARHGGYGFREAGVWQATPGVAATDGTPVHIFETAFAGAEQAALRLVRERRPDVIHLHPVELFPIANAVKQQTGLPLVYTVHSLNLAEYEFGNEPPEILNLWRMQRALIETADCVVALTKDERALLLDACPQAASRTHIVGNGIDDCALARATVRRTHNKTEPLVLYTGRFVERKGIRELFAVIPPVLQDAPDARFVLVGGYGSGADVARKWLPSELYVYRDRIHFTGWLKPAQVAEWYARADVLVVPSWYEPFGMVVLEGMLYGLPVVAANVGGPAEILHDGCTGLLFQARDAEALANKLIELVSDPDLRQWLGSRAAWAVRKHWLWKSTVQKMHRVYEDALN